MHVTMGGRRGASLHNFSSFPEKCVGHSLKLLDIVQQLWAPLRKLFTHLVAHKLVTGLLVIVCIVVTLNPISFI